MCPIFRDKPKIDDKVSVFFYLFVIAVFGLVVEHVEPGLWVEAWVVISSLNQGCHVMGVVQGFHSLQRKYDASPSKMRSCTQENWLHLSSLLAAI